MYITILTNYTRGMIHIWEQFLDIIFPPRETEIIIRKQPESTWKDFYLPRKLAANLFVLSRYDEKFIKAVIKENKFHRKQTATGILAFYLEKWLKNQDPETTLIVPIPLSSKREKERGYNQVILVLEAAKQRYPTSPLLKRTKETPPQSGLSRKERLHNLDNAFAIDEALLNKADFTKINTVILVDDVYTTGTTMRAAEKCLKEKLPKTVALYLLALAH